MIRKKITFDSTSAHPPLGTLASPSATSSLHHVSRTAFYSSAPEPAANRQRRLRVCNESKPQRARVNRPACRGIFAGLASCSETLCTPVGIEMDEIICVMALSASLTFVARACSLNQSYSLQVGRFPAFNAMTGMLHTQLRLSAQTSTWHVPVAPDVCGTVPVF